MYNRLDSIPACERQTDGQTSCHGIVRAMHTRRAVKKTVDIEVHQPETVIQRLCIFGPKGAIHIRYYYYYY